MPDSISALRFRAKRHIDNLAGSARLVHITDCAGQASVYAQKLDEAQGYLFASLDGPSPPAPPHIAAEAAARGRPAIDVARSIVEAANAWSGRISPAIEAARVAGKMAVDGADTPAAVEAAVANAAAALNATNEMHP